MKLKDLSYKLIEDSKNMESELIEIRRHLHKHPELSFKEFNTSAYVERYLRKYNIPCKRIGETGIVAIIKGEEKGPKFTVGLRADMDALPIREETELPFASINEGVMHACGHDGHTSILLGAARLLFDNRKNFSGTIVCIFQPGEEDDGAAEEMINLGVLENPKINATIALHLWPYLPFGVVGVRSGSMTASCDDFTIKISGKSGHSARPHEGIDAIAIATHLMQAIQYLVNKVYNPLDPVVVHIGKIQGGKARNIIADEVILEGTTRALSMENRKSLQKEIKKLVYDITSAYNATVDLDYIWGNAPVTNNEKITDCIKQAIQSIKGKNKVVELEKPSLGADDFGEFSQVVPSSYFRLGIEKSDEETYSLHHPKFNFDDSLLPEGSANFAIMALNVINRMGE